VSEAEILANHPRLSRDDVLACVGYAADLVKGERIHPLSA
jgi:uncharacterized protein (DUF433 family)